MSFSKGLLLWKKLEGGFVDNPHDPGGATFQGITKDDYLAANPGDPFPPSEADAANYLRANYWEKFHCGDMPEPVDSIFFQFVGSSERGAIQALQCIVGVIPDEDLGPATLVAMKGYGPNNLADDLLLAQRFFYAVKHPPGDFYFRGLQSRVKRVAAAWSAGEI